MTDRNDSSENAAKAATLGGERTAGLVDAALERARVEVEAKLDSSQARVRACMAPSWMRR